MSNLTNLAPTRPEQAITRSYRSYVLFLLVIVCVLSFVDRQIIVILSESIKRDFRLKDWQLGALTGFAFVLLYSFLGISIARIADRGRRSLVITMSLTIWSLFTIACGFAGNFIQLALSRVMVGVGEAGSTPSAHSLIAEYTPKEKRATAMAIYSAGIPLGSMLGLILGGLVADHYGWRIAFIVAGAPGIIVAFITATTLREPKTIHHGLQDAAAFTTLQALRQLFQSRSLILIATGAAMVGILNYGQGAFFPSFFFRNYAKDIASLAASVNHALGTHLGPIGFIGLTLGISSGVVGIVGTLIGGWLTDLLQIRNLRAQIDMQVSCAALRVPTLIAATLVPNFIWAICLLSLQTFFSGMSGPPAFAAVQGLARPHTRSTASAMFLFAINCVGMGVGPLMVGAFSDELSIDLGRGDGLRWALIVSEVFMVMGAYLFFLARKSFVEENVS